MKMSLIKAAIVFGVFLAACNEPKSSDDSAQKIDTTLNEKKSMKNLISIVEIPTTDFSRAITFYQSILDCRIEQTDMEGTQMGIFPAEENTVSVVLIKGNDYKPSADGPIVYLNGGNDLQIVLNKIEANGGKVVVPKTMISPEMGFFAMFIDTEGNKLGLHSLH